MAGISSLLHPRPWWLLLAVPAVEFVLFDQFGARRHTPVYPRWNDQVQYLGEAYTAYEHAREHGYLAGLWRTLVNPSAQGTLHDAWALVLFAFAGPSRSAALAVNMLALMTWQAALFFAVRRISGSSAVACAAAMLPLALQGPWDNIPGSAYDFRLDHLAMCAIGIALACGLLTEGFRSRRASIVFGAAVGLTLLTRFLTGTYFIVILLALMAWTARSTDRAPRLANLGLAALVAAALAAPFFWINREWVWNYYWIGHYVGPESAIRASHMGVGRSLGFLADHLVHRHLGYFAGGLALTGVVAFALARRGTPERSRRYHVPLLAGVFLLAPALVLTLHQQKSEVVVGALVPGTLTLVVAAWLAATRGAHGGIPINAGATIVVVAALGFFAQRQLKPAYDSATLADIRQVNALADTVVTSAQAAKLSHPRVATDYITDSLDGQVLRIICYERHRRWTPFEMTLPISIAEPTEAEVMERLRNSDFVFLGDGDSLAGPYPYDRKLAELRPKLRAWCEANLRVARRFTLQGRPAILFQRPEIPLP